MEQYHNLLNSILKDGVNKHPAREGMPGSTSLFGYQFRHSLKDGFPLLTTKEMFWRGIVIELLWFLRGDTNIKYLIDNGVNIWNEDAYNYYCKLCKKNNVERTFSFTDFVTIFKNNSVLLKEYNKIDNYKLGDCGFQYGKMWRSWPETICGAWDECINYVDQIKNVIGSLKNNPMGRRHIVTAIDPVHDNDLALYWCHAMFQFNCREIDDGIRAHWAVDNFRMHRNEFMFPDDIKNRTLEEQLDDNNIPKYYLDCQLYQRSADAFLGVPFNIASYGLLTHIIAKMCNMIPGEFIHTFGDVHIYDDHKNQVIEILNRDFNKYSLPKLKINSQLNFSDENIINSLKLEDFELSGYKSYPAIKAKLSTGLK